MFLDINKFELEQIEKITEYSNILEMSLNIGDVVLYEGEQHEIISIYSEYSPLCGYVLLSGIGNPVIASIIKNTIYVNNKRPNI